MAKITINGEVFQYDRNSHPMSEALALEKALGMRYAEYEAELEAGSMRALAGFVWTVWRRNGRDIPLDDLLEGKVEVDIGELAESLAALAEEAKAEEQENPTKAGSPSTGTNTSRSSRTTTGSGPGKSRS